MRGLKIIFSCFLFVVLFFCFENVLAAKSGYLVVNEFCSDPESGDSEWIELYNPTDVSIDLSLFTIEDGTNNPQSLVGILLPDEYIVLTKSVDFTFSLNNSGDIIILRQGNLVVDQVAYGNYDDGLKLDNAVAPDKGRSISRIPNGFDSNHDASDFRQIASTLGKENVLPKYLKDIIINEIIPKPENGAENEFVELHNTGDNEIDLSGWMIDDIEGGSKPYEIDEKTTIKSREYLAFYKSKTKVSLNDSGDSARLIDPNGDIVYTIKYDKAKKGYSYSFDGSSWLWSEKLTPNMKNIIQTTTQEEKEAAIIKSEIKEVKKLERGELVKVEGKVTSLPGDISKSYFYIQLKGAGIQIYNYHKDFPALRRGDLVEVLGEISEVAGEKRIKSESITVFGHEEESTPKEVKLEEIGEDNVGLLVGVTGEVVRPSGSTFYLTDGTDEVKVQVKNDQVNKPKLRSGYLVSVEGIVSKYKGSYRLLSFEAESVKIIESNQLSKGWAGCKNIN